MPSPGESSGTPEGDEGPPLRDREPPPYYDGEDPGKSFKPWLRELELRAFDTEVPKAKHGTRILRRLGGVAKAAANELETSEIVGEKGKDNIVARLKEYFAPHLETTMPKAFEAAVYGDCRGARESLGEYIVRMDAAFKNLKDEGVDLPSEAREYVMFRQARLNSVQEDQLTTWTEGRFSRDEQKNAREYYPTEKPKGKGKGSGKKGGGKGAGTRIHVSMLSCARVAQDAAKSAIGPPNAPTRLMDIASLGAGSTSSKTGFYQATGAGDPSAFWGEKPCSSDHCNHMCEGSAVQNPEETFSGVTTKSHHGIVDSAAQDGVIGKLALERLEEDLRSRGLRPRWCNRVVRTKGIGGEARSVGVCEIPLGIGGVAGVMEAAVVEGEVPLLLPVNLLKQLRSVINLDEECIELRALDTTLPMHRLPSGHYTIDVLDFGCREWQLPSAAARVGRKEEDFRTEPQPVGGSRSFGGFSLREGPGHEPLVATSFRSAFVTGEVMDKLIDLIVFADVQARMADWFTGSEPSKKTATKVADYKRWVVLPARKSKAAPAVIIQDCDHPQEHLRGAGNGHSRDVYCARCLARWDANGMEEYLAEVRKQEDAAMSGPVPLGTPNCLCGSPAVRLVTRKPGPTQGRHFWKCAARVCQYFEWDQAEIAKLQGEKRKEMADQKEHIEMLQAQIESNREQYERTMEAQRTQFQIALGQLQQHAAAQAGIPGP
ncbi:MHX, partial [Symbiodinium sp. KB8]